MSELTLRLGRRIMLVVMAVALAIVAAGALHPAGPAQSSPADSQYLFAPGTSERIPVGLVNGHETNP